MDICLILDWSKHFVRGSITNEVTRQHDAGEVWQFLDVRQPREIETASVPESIKIPMAEMPSRKTGLNAGTSVAALCHSGGRSAEVADSLAGRGFARVANIICGIDGRAQEVDNSLARY